MWALEKTPSEKLKIAMQQNYSTRNRHKFSLGKSRLFFATTKVLFHTWLELYKIVFWCLKKKKTFNIHIYATAYVYCIFRNSTGLLHTRLLLLNQHLHICNLCSLCVRTYQVADYYPRSRAKNWRFKSKWIFDCNWIP